MINCAEHTSNLLQITLSDSSFCAVASSAVTHCMQMLVIVTVDPEGHLLVLGRIICESESAESYVDLLTAVAGAEGSPAYELLHNKEMLILSDRGKAVISGVHTFDAQARHL